MTCSPYGIRLYVDVYEQVWWSVYDRVSGIDLVYCASYSRARALL